MGHVRGLPAGRPEEKQEVDARLRHHDDSRDAPVQEPQGLLRLPEGHTALSSCGRDPSGSAIEHVKTSLKFVVFVCTSGVTFQLFLYLTEFSDKERFMTI